MLLKIFDKCTLDVLVIVDEAGKVELVNGDNENIFNSALVLDSDFDFSDFDLP